MEELEYNRIVTLVTMERNYNIYIEYLRKNRTLIERLIKLSKMKELEIEPKETKEYCSVLDSIKIAKDFLCFLNPMYAKEFEEAITGGLVETANEYEDFEGYSYVETSPDNKFNAHVELEYTVEDIFTFVHEYFHISNEKFNENEDRYLYTELISILGEFLLADYLVKRNIAPASSKNEIIKRLKEAQDCGEKLSKMYELFDYAINHIPSLHSALYLVDEDKLSASVSNATAQLRNTTKYFIGTMIALIKYNDYISNAFDSDNFAYLNELVSRRNDTESISHTLIFFDEEYMEYSIKKSLKNFM